MRKNMKRILSFGVATLMLANTMQVSALTKSQEEQVYDAYINNFYQVNNGNGYFKETTSGGLTDFWKEAELIEMVIDAYEINGDSADYQRITELVNGFINENGTTWQHNTYNDDVMWMVIATTRAYLTTGNQEFLDLAKAEYQATYDRAYSADLGGGLWWTTDNHEKNACINAPAAIASYLLYKATDESHYLDKAKDLYQWVVNTLYRENTGSVEDHITVDENIDTSNYTYNQGTFIGISYLLYKETGESIYNDRALKALEYTKNVMSTNDLLPDEYGTEDRPGFKGIFIRWAMKYLEEYPNATYTNWIADNANTALNFQDDRGLIWAQWWRNTPSWNLDSWECSSAVELMLMSEKIGDSKRPQFFEHGDFGGKSITLAKGEYTLDKLNQAGLSNDWVSSLKVPEGFKVEIFEHDNFEGKSWIFTADTTYVGNECNDQLSSVKVTRDDD